MCEFKFELDDDTSKALLKAFDKIDREDFAKIMNGDKGFTLTDTKGNTSYFNAIVHCKDCKSCKHFEQDEQDCYCCTNECGIYDDVAEDDYCSFGKERKKKNDTNKRC